MNPATEQVECWHGCYGERGDLFTAESYRHPAKMGVPLCYRIFEHGECRGYWQRGDLILDPLAGIGTIGVVGASLGYNVVLVELERHFVEMAEENIQLLYTKAPRRGETTHGWVRVIQGDARRLSTLLDISDGVISSPPYSSEFREQHPGTAGGKVAQESERGGSFRGYSGIVSSPPYAPDHEHTTCHAKPGKTADEYDRRRGYTRKYGFRGYYPEELSGAVSSPPYTDQNLTAQGQFRSRFQPERPPAAGNPHEGYGSTPLTTCAGAVTSPPFSEAKGEGGINVKGYDPDGDDKVGERTYSARRAGTASGQIGNLRDPDGDIDAVLSSPPYENQLPGGSGFQPPHDSTRNFAEAKYSTSNNQIGQQQGQTYLAAMLEVYRQLYQVLRPGGVVCLVTKNPVKKGRIRRLDTDTIRLMEAAGPASGGVGFRFLERQRAMLTEELGEQLTFGPAGAEHRFQAVPIRSERKSFFKRLFERQHPELRVECEDILWFRKS